MFSLILEDNLIIPFNINKQAGAGGFSFLTSCETQDSNADFLSLFIGINLILDH